MYMIVKKYDKTAKVPSDKALSYYGFCTCGHQFTLQQLENQVEVCYNDRWHKAFDTSVRCPNCGAEFGHRYFCCTIGYDGKLYADYSDYAVPMFCVKADGDIMSVIREDSDEGWPKAVEAGRAFSPIQTTMEFDLSRGLRPVRIVSDG